MVITELLAGTPASDSKNRSNWSFHSIIDPKLIDVGVRATDYGSLLLKEKEVVLELIHRLFKIKILVVCKGQDPTDLKADPGLTEATVYRKLVGLKRGSERSGQWPILLSVVEHGEAASLADAAELLIKRSEEIMRDVSLLEKSREDCVSELEKFVTLRDHRAVDRLFTRLMRDLGNAQRELGSL